MQNISHEAWIPGKFYFIAMNETNAISMTQVLMDLQMSKRLVFKADMQISKRLSAKGKVMDLWPTVGVTVAFHAVSILGMHPLLRNI